MAFDAFTPEFREHQRRQREGVRASAKEEVTPKIPDAEPSQPPGNPFTVSERFRKRARERLLRKRG